MMGRAAMKIIMMSLIIFTTGCNAIDGVAKNALYPWKSVNKRIDERGNKQTPKYADLVPLASGGHIWASKRTDASYAVLYLHGNGESVVDLYDYNFIDKVLELNGWSWALVDYPGVGIGGVKDPTERSLVNMGSEALRALVRRLNPGAKVILWGRSLGAGVAAQVALKNQDIIDKVILVSPWSSFKAVARVKWPGRLISKKFYVEHSYKTDEACKGIEKPVLIVHGEQDKMIPFKQGAALSSCFKSSVLHKEAELGHNDIYQGSALNRIEAFIYDGK